MKPNISNYNFIAILVVLTLILKMSLSTFSGSFFHEATNRRSGRFLDEAIRPYLR